VPRRTSADSPTPNPTALADSVSSGDTEFELTEDPGTEMQTTGPFTVYIGEGAATRPVNCASRVGLTVTCVTTVGSSHDAGAPVNSGLAQIDFDAFMQQEDLDELTPADIGSPNLMVPGVMVPDGWGEHWFSRLENSDSVPARIGVIGASIDAGEFASNPMHKSFFGLIVEALKEQYGDGGSGFIGAHYSDPAFDGLAINASLQTAWLAEDDTCFATTGTWSADIFRGPGVEMVHSSAIGSTISREFLGTDLTIYTFNGNGSYANWRYRVDGGAWVDVTDSGTANTVRETEITGLSDATHTIEIEQRENGQQLYFSGVKATRANGVVPHWFVASGRGAKHFAGVTPAGPGDTRHWNGGRENPLDLAIVALGGNDVTQATPVTTPAETLNHLFTITQDIGRVLQEIRDGGSLDGDCDLILVLPHMGTFISDANKIALYERLIDETYGLAKAYGAAVVNCWELGRNSRNNWLNAGYFGQNNVPAGNAGTDTVHLSDSGFEAIRDAMQPIVMGEYR
jgi:hypothetical protein